MKRFLSARRAMTMAAGEAGSPLLNNLYAYYKMDETTGTRFDSMGNWDLDSLPNGMGNDTGVIGNATEHTTASSTFIHSNLKSVGLGFDGGGNFSIAYWVKFKATGSQECMVSHYSGAGSQAFLVQKNASDAIQLRTSNAGSGVTATSTYDTVSSGTWYHIAMVHDTTADTTEFYIDGTAKTTHSDGIAVVANYYVIWGALGNSGDFLGGYLDEIGCWQRKITADEVTQLYNGGAGITHPF